MSFALSKERLNRYLDFLSELFIFKSLPREALNEILTKIKFEIFDFEAGEKIYTPDGFKKNVGFILKGECLVEKIKRDNTFLPLNTLRIGDSFGILAVFSTEERYPTQIKAKRKTTVFFLDNDTVINLAKEYPEIALSIISFMSEKISFLNKKIDTFSADSVEEKLSLYLLAEASEKEEILLNPTKTAKLLNAGRASIYRAISVLERLSLIKFDNKKIYILNREGLERITK